MDCGRLRFWCRVHALPARTILGTWDLLGRIWRATVFCSQWVPDYRHSSEITTIHRFRTTSVFRLTSVLCSTLSANFPDLLRHSRGHSDPGDPSSSSHYFLEPFVFVERVFRPTGRF